MAPQTFAAVAVLDCDRATRCVMVFHCSFGLHFPDDIGGEASHTLICHLYIMLSELSEVSLGALPYFLIRLFVLLSFKCSLPILDSSLLSEVFCKYFLSVCGRSSHSLDGP